MVMLGADRTAVLSPSDLIASSQCMFGWLRTVDEHLGRTDPQGGPNALLDRLSQLGQGHEARELARIAASVDVITIGRTTPYGVEGLVQSASLTRAALAERRPAIAQAAFFDGGFGGSPIS